MSPLALRFQDLREAQGWSQADLALRSGVDQGVIARLESGDIRMINFPNLEKLATAFGCELGHLIVRRED